MLLMELLIKKVWEPPVYRRKTSKPTAEKKKKIKCRGSLAGAQIISM